MSNCPLLFKLSRAVFQVLQQVALLSSLEIDTQVPIAKVRAEMKEAAFIQCGIEEPNTA